MQLVFWLLSATVSLGAVYENQVFKQGETYEQTDDLLLQNTPQSGFLFRKSPLQNIINLHNKTHDPKKTVWINLYFGDDTPFTPDDFSAGKSVIIKKGTQWQIVNTRPHSVTLESLRASPKHSITCDVEILSRNFFAVQEVGDMNQCLTLLKLKKRKTEPTASTYIIE